MLIIHDGGKDEEESVNPFMADKPSCQYSFPKNDNALTLPQHA
jgi:hypothetical protein